MRFVSKYQRYTSKLKESDMALLNGIEVETTKSVHAKFNHGGLMDWEVEAGLEAFAGGMTGLPEGVPPQTRFSVFDTERAQREQRWTDEEREAYEQRLLGDSMHGIDFIHVPEPRLEAPWPTFDSFSVQDALERLVELGFDLEYAYRYEHENQARPEMLDALKRLQQQSEAAADEIVIA